MDLPTLQLHFARFRHHLGEPLTLGAKAYRLRGFHANRLHDNPDHERFLTPVLARLLDGRSGAFIDVGANVGQTLTKVLTIDPGRRYVGFEPQIACCFFLEQFVRDNRLDHVTVLPLALSDENRVLTLYSDAGYDEMASIDGVLDAAGKPRSLTTHVAARVGDEVLREIDAEVAAIKIDVEGAELQVLSGLERTLEEQKPPLLFEVLPNFFGAGREMLPAHVCTRNREKADRLHGFLKSFGYDIRQVSEAGVERPISRFDLDDRVDYGGSNFTAYAR